MGLAASIGLAGALLLTAAGQARGPEKDSNLVHAAALEITPETRGSETSEYSLLSPAQLTLNQQARDVVVAVLDTGIDATHPDLAGRIVGEKNFSPSTAVEDRNGHGTHIAGIIAATPNASSGRSAIAPVSRLLNVKVADDYGLCDESNVARAIIWAADNGASVINVSLELRDPSPELEQAVDYAWGHGALVIAAAGNDGSSQPVYPASYQHSLAVNASAGDRLAPLSNYGTWVDVAAPGYQVYSTLPGNSYGYETGTSFAAAKVSGLAALLFGTMTDDNGDGRINDEVRNAIEISATPATSLGTAHGEVDFARALSLAAGKSN